MDESRSQVILSAQALRDLKEIVAYIATDDPRAAERFGYRLISEAEAIGTHPRAGRMVPEFRDSSIRERTHRNYRIVYRVEDEDRIVVSRFWHAARGTPELPSNDL